jgi:uncharacterized protein YaaQ
MGKALGNTSFACMAEDERLSKRTGMIREVCSVRRGGLKVNKRSMDRHARVVFGGWITLGSQAK